MTGANSLHARDRPPVRERCATYVRERVHTHTLHYTRIHLPVPKGDPLNTNIVPHFIINQTHIHAHTAARQLRQPIHCYVNFLSSLSRKKNCFEKRKKNARPGRISEARVQYTYIQYMNYYCYIQRISKGKNTMQRTIISVCRFSLASRNSFVW